MMEIDDDRGPGQLVAEIAKYRQESRDARALVAALVLQYGEHVVSGHKRAGLSADLLERVAGASLSVHMDPGSGAVLIHVREG